MHGRLTVGVLAAALAVAGCAVDQPVSPLPTEAFTTGATPPRSAGVSATASPPTSRPASSPVSRRPVSRRPSRTPTPAPTTSPTPPSPPCEGAVVHTIDLTTDELALVPSLCVGVGSVLRIENIGPGEVTNDSPDLVDPNYEAGIQEIRFLRAGTVVVTIPQEGNSYDITVVVR
jgi:hypothetical protein